MLRYVPPILLMLMLGLVCQSAGAAEEDGEFGIFPRFVWITAYDLEPDEYDYWSVGYWPGYLERTDPLSASRFSLAESGYCCPSVVREVHGPGVITVSFRFYDENDRYISGGTKSVYIDEYGLELPSWESSWWDDYGLDPFDRGSDELSLIDYPWPAVDLRVTLSGSGPWTAECRAVSDIPAKWFQSFEWDLDHDGRFNRFTGRNPQYAATITRPGKYIFAVRATDMRGYSTIASAEFTVDDSNR